MRRTSFKRKKRASRMMMTIARIFIKPPKLSNFYRRLKDPKCHLKCRGIKRVDPSIKIPVPMADLKISNIEV